MGNRRIALLAGAAVTVLLTATACGSGGDTSSATTTVKAAAQATPASAPLNQSAAAAPNQNAAASPSQSVAAATPQSVSAGQLIVRDDGKLGPLVTDSAGMTLYRFDNDTANPSASNCNDACAVKWPPIPADGASASHDLNSGLLGSVTRADGSKQLTLAGWPLYHFSGDTKPGDTNGQNVGGTWFAAAPDGKKAGVARPALGVLNDPQLGTVLTDKNGKTLYLFTKDQPWPMKTACDATCLQKWTPSVPVTAADAKAVGLDPKVLFTFTTPDGTKQESINCWPAYTFNGDTAPGQTNGENVGGVWFAIKATDVKIDRGKTIPAAKPGAGGTAGQPAGKIVPPSDDSSYGSGGY